MRFLQNVRKYLRKTSHAPVVLWELWNTGLADAVVVFIRQFVFHFVHMPCYMVYMFTCFGLQMLSDVISKFYEELKREVENRSWWKKRAS